MRKPWDQPKEAAIGYAPATDLSKLADRRSVTVASSGRKTPGPGMVGLTTKAQRTRRPDEP